MTRHESTLHEIALELIELGKRDWIYEIEVFRREQQRLTTKYPLVRRPSWGVWKVCLKKDRQLPTLLNQLVLNDYLAVIGQFLKALLLADIFAVILIFLLPIVILVAPFVAVREKFGAFKVGELFRRRNLDTLGAWYSFWLSILVGVPPYLFYGPTFTFVMTSIFTIVFTISIFSKIFQAMHPQLNLRGWITFIKMKLEDPVDEIIHTLKLLLEDIPDQLHSVENRIVRAVTQEKSANLEYELACLKRDLQTANFLLEKATQLKNQAQFRIKSLEKTATRDGVDQKAYFGLHSRDLKVHQVILDLINSLLNLCETTRHVEDLHERLIKPMLPKSLKPPNET